MNFICNFEEKKKCRLIVKVKDSQQKRCATCKGNASAFFLLIFVMIYVIKCCNKYFKLSHFLKRKR